MLREIYFLLSLGESIDIFYCKYNVVCLRAATSFQHDNQVKYPLQREIQHGILTTVLYTHTYMQTCIYTEQIWSVCRAGHIWEVPRSKLDLDTEQLD